MNHLLVVIALAGCSGSSAAPDARPDAEPEVTPPDGVVAWFQLNGQFTDAMNRIPMALGGPLFGFFAEGRHNGGGYFDGATQRMLVDPNGIGGILNFSGPFSIGMWIRPEQAPSDFGVIASRMLDKDGDSSFALILDSTLRLRYDSQGGSSLTGATPLQVERWTHIALTFDGTTKRLFIDGTLDGSGPAAGPVTWDRRYIVFGADGDGYAVGNHHIMGSLDDVMLFDRAVSDVELAALAAQ